MSGPRGSTLCGHSGLRTCHAFPFTFLPSSQPMKSLEIGCDCIFFGWCRAGLLLWWVVCVMSTRRESLATRLALRERGSESPRLRGPPPSQPWSCTHTLIITTACSREPPSSIVRGCGALLFFVIVFLGSSAETNHHHPQNPCVKNLQEAHATVGHCLLVCRGETK